MSRQLIVVSTREAMDGHKEVFASLPAAGMPLLALTSYLIEELLQGEPQLLTCQQLLYGWFEYIDHSPLMNERIAELMHTPEFAEALYALYQSMQHFQELILSLPERERRGFLSGLSHHGWHAGDLVLAREVTLLGGGYA